MAGTDNKDKKNQPIFPEDNNSDSKKTNKEAKDFIDNLENLNSQINQTSPTVNNFGKDVVNAGKGFVNGAVEMSTAAKTFAEAVGESKKQTQRTPEFVNPNVQQAGRTGGTASTKVVFDYDKIAQDVKSWNRDKIQIDTSNMGARREQQRTYIPESDRYRTSTGTRPHLFGKVGETMGSDLNKNMLQMNHMLSPASFGTYALMFGAGFPMQLKMAETITSPVTAVSEKYEMGKSFANGITGIGDAMKGFSGQLQQSPFQMYENLYQSKILLSSALGGDRQSNKAITTALQMAREYPVKTEQVLSSLSRLSVYPQVKPHLQSEDFQKKLMESVSGLSLIVPEQGMEGAMFSLVEAMSGSWRSLQMRFNISPEVVESLSGMSKGEMSSDPTKLIEGLHRFVGKSVGLDVLEKQKYTFSKQVDNFGDSLQMMTRNVFEQTGLYKTISGGATAFQTGFGALAQNKDFLNFVGKITTPFQERTDNAFAKFIGMPTGLYKQSPLSQVTKVLEENFENLSYEEIGTKFNVLIDDMSSILADTNKSINTIFNAAFGKTLGDIGSDIAGVVGSNFQQMAMGVIKGFAVSMIENPMDIALTVGSIAFPVMATLLGGQLAVTKLQSLFAAKTLAQRGMAIEDSFFGTHAALTSIGKKDLSKGQSAIKYDKKKGTYTGKSILQEDRIMTDLLYAPSETAFKNTDTKRVMSRIAKIAEGDLNKTNSELLKITYKDKLRSLELPKEHFFGVGKTATKDAKHIMDQKAVDILGLDAKDSKGQRKLTKITDEEFMRSKLLKDATIEGTDLGALKKSGLKDSNKIIRNILEARIGQELGGSLRTSKFTSGGDNIAFIDTLKTKTNSDDIRRNISGRTENFYIDSEKDLKMIDRLNKSKKEGGLDLGIGTREKLLSPDEFLAGKGNKRALSAFIKASPDNEVAWLKYKDLYADNETKYMRYNSNVYTPDYGISPEMLAATDAGHVSMLKSFAEGAYDVEVNKKAYGRTLGLLGSDKNLASGKLGNVSLGADINGGSNLNLIDDLIQNDNMKQFVTDRQAFLKRLGGATAEEAKEMMTGVTRGSQAFKAIMNNNEVFEDVTKAMESGQGKLQLTRRLNAVTDNRLGRAVMEKGMFGVAKHGAAAALGVLDVPLTGFMVSGAMKDLGASETTSTTAGLAASGVVAGGLTLAGYKKGAGISFGRTMSTMSKLGGVGALTALYAGIETFQGYAEGSKSYRGQVADYRKGLADYGLNSKDYEKFYNVGDTFKYGPTRAFTDKDRREGGLKGISDNLGDIGLAGGLGIAAGVLGAIATGGLAIPAIAMAGLGMGALSAGGTGLASYFRGAGKLSNDESYMTESISGFLGNRKFFTDRSKNMTYDIDQLEYKRDSVGLSNAEGARLRNLKNDRAVSDRMAESSLSAAKSVSEVFVSSEDFDSGKNREISKYRDPKYFEKQAQDEMDLAMTGVYVPSFDTRSVGELVKDDFTKAEQNLLGYLQKNKGKANDGKTAEQMVGGYLAAQSYMLDQYNPEVTKVFMEGTPEEKQDKSIKYAKVYNELDQNYNETMDKINPKDTDQIEIMKQAKIGLIRSIQLPLGDEEGDKEAMQSMREKMVPSLIKTFVKADQLSVIGENKNVRNANSEIASTAEAKLGQFGLDNPYDAFKKDFSKLKDDTPTKFGEDFDRKTFSKNEASVIKSVTGKDIADPNQQFGFADINKLKSEEGKAAFLKAGGTESQYNKFSKNLDEYKKSDDVLKSEAYDVIRSTGIQQVATTFGTPEGQKALEAKYREFSAYSNLSYSNFSPTRKDVLERNRESYKMNLDKYTNFGAELNKIDGVNVNDGIDKNEEQLILKSGKMAEFQKVQKELDSSYQELTNSANGTAETTTNTLGQALEKTNALFQETAKSGNSMTTENFMARFKEQKYTVDTAFASQKAHADVKDGSANADFNYLTKEKGVDFSLIEGFMKDNGKSLVGGSITQASDLIKTDERGVSNLEKINSLGAETLKYAGLDKPNMEILAGIGSNQIEARDLRANAASQEFDYMEKQSQAATSLTSAGNPFQPLAKSMADIDYEQTGRMRDQGITDLKKAMVGYSSATDVGQKAFFKGQIQDQMQNLASLGVNTMGQRGMVGEKLYDSTTKKVVDDALNTDPNKLNAVYSSVLGGKGMDTAGKLVAELDTKSVRLDLSGTPFKAIDEGAKGPSGPVTTPYATTKPDGTVTNIANSQEDASSIQKLPDGGTMIAPKLGGEGSTVEKPAELPTMNGYYKRSDGTYTNVLGSGGGVKPPESDVTKAAAIVQPAKASAEARSASDVEQAPNVSTGAGNSVTSNNGIRELNEGMQHTFNRVNSDPFAAYPATRPDSWAAASDSIV